MSCSKKILASNSSSGCVYECSCGTIHIAVGPVDLKFTRANFLEIHAMLSEAVEQMKPSTEIGEAVQLLMDTPQAHIN
jgi:hypothetical protein